MASAAFRRLPNHDFPDILGAANHGLVDAARRFNPSLHVPFEAYARTRISGTIIDSHRSLHKVAYVNEFPPEPVVQAAQYTIRIEAEKLRNSLRPALAILTDDEQRIIRLRYTGELTLREIAEEMGLTECRISQLHKAILIKLRPRVERLRYSLPD